MKISKGTKLRVDDKRKGRFFAEANSDFDTEDEWYDILLDQDYLGGMSNDWVRGEHVPARNGLSRITIIEADKAESEV